MPSATAPGARRWRQELRLRHRLRRELRTAGIASPMPMVEVCRLLAEHRGRPIRTLPYPLPVPGAFGAWLSTPTADYLLYQRETTPAHQEHILAHEIGHMLCGHEADELDGEVWVELLPDVPPEHIRRALRRTHYDSDDERAAETAATLLLERAATYAERASRSGSSRARHAQDALVDPTGWL